MTDHVAREGGTSSRSSGVTVIWVGGAAVMFFASFVMGLTGFGIAIVAMAFLPWLMSPVTAVVLLTLYAAVFLIFMVIHLRREMACPRSATCSWGRLLGPPLGSGDLLHFPSPL